MIKDIISLASFRNKQLQKMKDRNKYEIDKKNIDFENEIKNIENDKKLMNARIELAKTKFENEKTSSKLDLLETAKTIKLKAQLYPLMLMSAIVTPMGFNLIDHVSFDNNFINSLTNEVGKTILLLFFFTLQLVGFKASSRHSIVQLIYNKDTSMSTIALILFIPLSIIGNVLCFVNWIGGGVVNIVFLSVCAVLIELYIHHLSRLDFNIRNKNYSFKEDNENEFQTSIFDMLKTIVTNKIRSKLFDSYVDSKKSIVEMNTTINKENDKNNESTNKEDEDNLLVNNKENNKDNIINFNFKNMSDDSELNVKNNTEENDNLKTLCCSNVENEDGNKEENKVNSKETNKEEEEANVYSNKETEESNLNNNKEISKEELEKYVTNYVKTLKINEKFDDKKLSYLNVGSQRIRRIKDKLKQQGILASKDKVGTFKVKEVD